MGKPYIPGHWSRQYAQLPAARRDQINQETNQLFTSYTGITRKLDPDKDKDYVGIWLRLRDEVMAGTAKRSVGTFLEVEGLKGTASDPGHRGWINVASFSWGGRRPTHSHMGGTSESTGLNDLVITLDRDAAGPGVMPKLAEFVANARYLGRCTLSVKSAHNTYRFTMSRVFLSSYQEFGDTATISLNYQGISYDFR